MVENYFFFCCCCCFLPHPAHETIASPPLGRLQLHFRALYLFTPRVTRVTVHTEVAV